MKLPSFNYLLNNAAKAFVRFPATILTSLVGVCVAIYLVEYHNDVKNFLPYVNVMLCAALGIPLFFSASILSEKSGSLPMRIGGIGIAAIILTLVFFSFPSIEETHNTFIPYIRYALFNAIAHLVVSFVPYLKTGSLNGFWNYNKGLFIRICTSALYSAVLYVGLALALVSLKVLFDVDLHEELFFEIWIVIVGFFNTWFFVAGIPEDIDALENVTDYPRGLKIFTQYILLPLLILYLVILYCYGMKIVLSWDWPKGIISYMIAVIAVLGIFTLLLIHPYAKQEGNGWIKKFTNVYYISLFPLIALLFFAIWLRVDDYGITINRYAIVLLGIWLTLVAVYFAMMRGQNIKFIPISLALMMALTSFGPWGIFSYSEHSQVDRLEHILTESGILVDGKIQNEVKWTIDGRRLTSLTEENNEGILNDSLHNEVLSIMNYLDNFHGFSAIRPWFEQDVDSVMVKLIDAGGDDNEARFYMKTMGLKFNHRYETVNPTVYYEFDVADEAIIPINEYQFMATFSMGTYNGAFEKKEFEIDGKKYEMVDQKNQVVISSDSDVLTLDLTKFMEDLAAQQRHDPRAQLERKRLTLTGSTQDLNVTVVFQNLEMRDQDAEMDITRGSGYVFLSRK